MDLGIPNRVRIGSDRPPPPDPNLAAAGRVTQPVGVLFAWSGHGHCQFSEVGGLDGLSGRARFFFRRIVMGERDGAAAVARARRGALKSSSRHWTDALQGSEHATTRLGAKFHLRKLFLRAGVDEFSQSELEYISQYLIHETTIAEQPWWAALTRYEQLEIVTMLELHHVPKGEDRTLWFSSKETSKECVLLYGTAEAKPVDRNLAPVLKFTEGSVVGNLKLGTSHRAPGEGTGAVGGLPDVVVSLNASSNTWRRVKREQAFRNGAMHYNKLTITGPADYFVLTSGQILQTTSKAADRLEREQLLRAYGLERFLGCIRKKTFESGAILAHEDEQLQALYFVLEGECRASVRVDDLAEVDPFAERKVANAGADALLNGYRPPKSPRRVSQLAIASLGPRSLVGDVSMLLGLKEPATIQAVTAVSVLALAHDDYVKEAGDMSDPVVAAPVESMKKVALETVRFVLDRVKAEAAYSQCDQMSKVELLERWIVERQPELEIPHARRMRQLSSSVSAAPYQSLSVRVTNGTNSLSQPSSPPSSHSPSSPRQDKIPSVVLKYMETVQQKSPRASSGESLGPVILSRRPHKAAYDITLSLTREQRKAAVALNSLHSPLATKSLGYHPRSPISEPNREEDDDVPHEISHRADDKMSHTLEQDDREPRDELFLVPTMTRQRQLHTRSLPLLPKCRFDR